VNFGAGEISAEQYQEMRRTLEPTTAEPTTSA
jgi:hypothetical protein